MDPEVTFFVQHPVMNCSFLKSMFYITDVKSSRVAGGSINIGAP